MKKDIHVKFAGYSIICILLFLCLSISAIISLELLGVTARMIALYQESGRPKSLPLHQTDYYGKPLKADPYSNFTIQYLHPYYLFSLPWQKADRLNANNEYVKVDESGFRMNPLLRDQQSHGVLLGGSSAFGHFSSSDGKTLAAALTQKSGIGFVNRNAPSWNSHQELIALVKFSDRYNVSVSFSLANDIEIFCKHNAFPIKDVPESFRKLNSFFNDIRGRPLRKLDRWSIVDTMSWLLPDTVKLYTLYKGRRWGNPEVKSGKSDQDFCGGQEEMLVETFLKNQMAMRQITNARGARHLLVIQPEYSLHITSHTKLRRDTDNVRNFKRRVIGKIMGSDFCREDCLNLSTVFDVIGGATILAEGGGANYGNKKFVDEVHLTDTGVDIVADQISTELKYLNPIWRDSVQGVGHVH